MDKNVACLGYASHTQALASPGSLVPSVHFLYKEAAPR